MASFKKRSFSFSLVVLVLLGVFCLPPIENRTEAEDAFTYALEVEKLPYGQLFHPNHRLYHPLAKGIFVLSKQERSFEVLAVFSGVMAVGSLFVFYFLIKKLTGAGNWQSLAWTVCLAFSYGFWRYAREVEVYAMGWLGCLSVLALFFLWKGGRPWVRGVMYAVVVVVALNIHRALGPPLLVIGLVDLFIQRQWLAGLVSAGVGLLLYSVCEVSADALPTRKVSLAKRGELSDFFEEELKVDRKQLSKKRPFRLSSLPKGAIGLGVSLLGGNVLMASEPVYEFFSKELFPYRFLAEEKMMVDGTSSLWILFWLLGVFTVVFLIGTAGKMLWRSVRKGELPNSSEKWAVLAGLGCYLVMIIVFEPGNPEMWLLGLPLVWLALALWLPRFPCRQIWFLGGALLVTNYVGGMFFLASKENDYHDQTSRLVRGEARAGDIYLMGTLNSVHARYVRYAVEVEVSVVKVGDRRTDEFYRLVGQHIQQGRRVFVHESLVRKDVKFEESLTKAGLILSGTYKGNINGGELLLQGNG